MRPIGMKDMLTLSAHLPEIEFAPGDIVVHEGGAAGGIWILVIRRPAGEAGGTVLVNTDHAARRADRRDLGVARLRVQRDSRSHRSAASCATRPTARHFSRAIRPSPRSSLSASRERLNFVTTYLADLKHQYGDAPGLSMVPDVLRRLAQRRLRSRDPDPLAIPTLTIELRGSDSNCVRRRFAAELSVRPGEDLRRQASIATTPNLPPDRSRCGVGTGPICRPALKTHVLPMRSAHAPSGLNGGSCT